MALLQRSLEPKKCSMRFGLLEALAGAEELTSTDGLGSAWVARGASARLW